MALVIVVMVFPHGFTHCMEKKGLALVVAKIIKARITNDSEK